MLELISDIAKRVGVLGRTQELKLVLAREGPRIPTEMRAFPTAKLSLITKETKVPSLKSRIP